METMGSVGIDGVGTMKVDGTDTVGTGGPQALVVVNAAMLKSKLKAVLMMKRALLQKKIDLSKTTTTAISTTGTLNRSGSGGGGSARQFPRPITALQQMTGSNGGLRISNISSGPDHFTRIFPDLPFEGVSWDLWAPPGGGGEEGDQKMKAKGSKNKRVQEENTSLTTAVQSDIVDGSTAASPPDRKLRKRKLELQAQLVVARLKKSNLELFQKTTRSNSAVELQCPGPVVETTKCPPCPAAVVPPEASQSQGGTFNRREELLQKKKTLQFRSKMTNLKQLISKQQELMESQEESLVATEAALLETDKALVEVTAKLTKVRDKVQTSQTRVQALIEVEKTQFVRLLEAKRRWQALSKKEEEKKKELDSIG